MRCTQRRSLSWASHLLIFLALVLVIGWLRQGLPLDHYVSDFFFKKGEWVWPKKDETLTFWLHDFIKNVFVFTGVACLALSIASKYIDKLKPYRYMALLVTLSLIITPSIISGMKAQTHIFCPSKLERYDGRFPDDYRKMNLGGIVLNKARCFPAGHASPGFALFILGTGAATKRRRVAGYAAGTLAGSALSLIQIGRGEHFLTHCIASALIGLWVAFMLTYAVNYARHREWI